MFEFTVGRQVFTCLPIFIFNFSKTSYLRKVNNKYLIEFRSLRRDCYVQIVCNKLL